MIRQYQYEARIQKSDGEIYYPPVIAFSTADSLPFENSPEASIKVVANENLSGIQSMTSIEFDDIITLSVSISYHPKELPVMVPIFEGKVQNISKDYGSGATVTLQCVGHIYEVFETLELVAHDWTTTTDAKTIISTLMAEANKLSRVEYNADDVEAGLTFSAFNVESKKVYLSTVMQDIEEASGYTMYFDTRQEYSRWNILQHIYLTFKTLPTVETWKYRIKEGSNRLLSATVELVGEDVKTYRYVNGGTDESTGNPYSASASDAASVALYGPRHALDTYSWILSTSLCLKVAEGLLDGSNEPYVSISCTIEGTPDAKKGDLVEVEFLTLDLKGVTVSGSYVVAKVQHILEEGNGYKTMIDLNRVKMTPTEYTIKYLTKKLNRVYINQG